MEAMESLGVTVDVPDVKPDELASSLRLDESAVFSRIERGSVVLGVRTITDEQVSLVAAAVTRCIGVIDH